MFLSELEYFAHGRLGRVDEIVVTKVIHVLEIDVSVLLTGIIAACFNNLLLI